MRIELSPALFAMSQARAAQLQIGPSVFAERILRQHLAKLSGELPTPQDEWERSLLNAAIDCGVSFSDEDVSSEGIYDYQARVHVTLPLQRSPNIGLRVPLLYFRATLTCVVFRMFVVM